MELKEYLKIIKKHKKVFFTTWGVILFLAWFIVFVRPIIYTGEVTAFTIRNSQDVEEIVSKEYDYHYRLEADGKLAEILVQYLNDKFLLKESLDIKGYEMSEGLNLKVISRGEKDWIMAHITGEVLSSGYIKVYINSHEENLIEPISNRLFEQLESRMLKIGNDKNKKIGLEISPVIISQKEKMYIPVELGAFFGGLLVAIFTVLGVHYWREE